MNVLYVITEIIEPLKRYINGIVAYNNNHNIIIQQQDHLVGHYNIGYNGYHYREIDILTVNEVVIIEGINVVIIRICSHRVPIYKFMMDTTNDTIFNNNTVRITHVIRLYIHLVYNYEIDHNQDRRVTIDNMIIIVGNNDSCSYLITKDLNFVNNNNHMYYMIQMMIRIHILVTNLILYYFDVAIVISILTSYHQIGIVTVVV